MTLRYEIRASRSDDPMTTYRDCRRRVNLVDRSPNAQTPLTVGRNGAELPLPLIIAIVLAGKAFRCSRAGARSSDE